MGGCASLAATVTSADVFAVAKKVTARSPAARVVVAGAPPPPLVPAFGRRDEELASRLEAI